MTKLLTVLFLALAALPASASGSFPFAPARVASASAPIVAPGAFVQPCWPDPGTHRTDISLALALLDASTSLPGHINGCPQGEAVEPTCADNCAANWESCQAGALLDAQDAMEAAYNTLFGMAYDTAVANRAKCRTACTDAWVPYTTPWYDCNDVCEDTFCATFDSDDMDDYNDARDAAENAYWAAIATCDGAYQACMDLCCVPN